MPKSYTRRYRMTSTSVTTTNLDFLTLTVRKKELEITFHALLFVFILHQIMETRLTVRGRWFEILTEKTTDCLAVRHDTRR